MTDEEKKAKTKEYGDRYTAKDPERRKEQKRKAQLTYRLKNPEKAKAANARCDKARKERDPEAYLAKQRANSEKARRKAGMKPQTRMPEELRKEKARAACRAWVAKDPDYARMYARDWARRDREANPEKYAEINSKRVKDPVKTKAYNKAYKHTRRAISKSERLRVGKIDFDAYDKTLELFDYRCVYCRDAATTIDHVVAIMQGGTNHHTNLLPACKSCNSSKWKHHLGTWLQRPRAQRVLARPYDYEPPQEVAEATQ